MVAELILQRHGHSRQDQNGQANELVYQRPESLLDMPLSYCPGCGHGRSTAWWPR